MSKHEGMRKPRWYASVAFVEPQHLDDTTELFMQCQHEAYREGCLVTERRLIMLLHAHGIDPTSWAIER